MKRSTKSNIHPNENQCSATIFLQESLVIGERMPESYKAEVLRILNQNYPAATVKIARRARDTYKLIIE